MKKRHFTLLVLFSLVLIIGQSCESSNKGEGVFLGGSQGLSLNFLDDAPPISGNFQNEAFPIDIQLANKGETEIGQGSAIVYLTGAIASSNVFTSTLPSLMTSNVEFISPILDSDKGLVEDSIVVPLGDATYRGEILGDSIPVDVRASVCYPYSTKVQLNEFCVPSTSRTANSDTECTIDPAVNLIKEKDNSGAPVHVVSLKEQEGPDFVRITLDINNVGSGQVVNTCQREITRDNLDNVRVAMPQNYLCTFKDGESSSGLVELRSGHAVLRCKRDINNPGSSFKEPLALTLNYNYMQEVSKTVSINKA